MKELSRHKAEINRETAKIKKSLRAEVKQADKFTEGRERRQRKKRTQAKNVYDAIGFDLMFDQTGICQVEEGLFSQTVDFSDVTYQSADIESQEAILDLYAQVFDGCGPDVSLQVMVVNTPVPESQIGKKEFFEESDNDQLNEYVREYNDVLNRKMMEGVSNIHRSRYITYGVKAQTYEEALPKLQSIYTTMAGTFDKMGSHARKIDGKERLGLISSLIRPYTEYDFDYESLIISGLTAKDSICPNTLDFRPDGLDDVFKSDGVWCQALVIQKDISQLDDMVLSELVDLPIPLCVSMHIHPLDKGEGREMVRKQLMWIDKDVTEKQQKAVRKGYDINNLPQELKYSKSDGEELLNELQYKNQNYYEFTGLVYTYAKTFEELRDNAVKIVRTARRAGLTIEALECQQRVAMNSVLPLASNHIGTVRHLTTTQIAMFIPFATSELNQDGGGYYGQNKVSNNLILLNRKSLAAPMGWVFGLPGSGKSFGNKREITNSYLTHPEAEFLIIDPKDEYSLLVEAFGGSVMKLEHGSTDRINVFDFYDGLHQEGGNDPIDYKAETIQAITSVVMGSEEGRLSSEEKTIVDRCVRLTYGKVGRERVPKLEDFYETLKEQPEEEAKRLAMSYELYVTGGQRYFNTETTVDLNRRITCFSFQKLGADMRLFAMLVILDFVYNRMLYNYKRGVETWLYIDEVQSLFTTPTVIEYFDKFWAEGRSYNLVPTAITQTPARVIDHEQAKYLIRNSDFIMLYKLSPIDRKSIVELLNLSPQQEQAIGAGASPGEGLLVAGASTIPFTDNWPKGRLYDLWTTKPEELAQRNKAEWLARQKGVEGNEEPALPHPEEGKVEEASAEPEEEAPRPNAVEKTEGIASTSEDPVEEAPAEPEKTEKPAKPAKADKASRSTNKSRKTQAEPEKALSTEERVRQAILNNPGGSYNQLARECGLASSTVSKWAKTAIKGMERNDRVRVYFARNKKATAAEAAKEFGVSATTIRRWLKKIEEEDAEKQEGAAAENDIPLAEKPEAPRTVNIETAEREPEPEDANDNQDVGGHEPPHREDTEDATENAPDVDVNDVSTDPDPEKNWDEMVEGEASAAAAKLDSLPEIKTTENGQPGRDFAKDHSWNMEAQGADGRDKQVIEQEEPAEEPESEEMAADRERLREAMDAMPGMKAEFYAKGLGMREPEVRALLKKLEREGAVEGGFSKRKQRNRKKPEKTRRSKARQSAKTEEPGSSERKSGPMGTRCSSCGSYEPVDSKFCGKCGSLL